MSKAGGTTTVSPRDAVVALLFLGLEGYSLPTEFQQSLLGLIDQQPVVNTLTETLTTLMAGNPHVLADGDAEFEGAVRAALPDLRASPTATRHGNAERAGDTSE